MGLAYPASQRPGANVETCNTSKQVWQTPGSALPALQEFKERLQNARSVLESIRMVLPGYVPVVQAKPPVPVDKTRARRKRPPTSLEEDSKAEASSIIQQPAAEAIPQKVPLLIRLYEPLAFKISGPLAAES